LLRGMTLVVTAPSPRPPQRSLEARRDATSDDDILAKLEPQQFQ
jgi:hypothetical protein